MQCWPWVKCWMSSRKSETGAFFSHYDPAMVEWFAKMVEERKKNHDCTKEKKDW